MAILSCSIADCDKSGKLTRGMCMMHYQRVRKQERAVLSPCAISGCSNPGAGPLLYCNTHARRLEVHGDPLVTMKGKAHKVQYDASGLRICKVCGEGKQLTEYHADKGGTDGYRAQCKQCRNQYMKTYHAATGDARRDYMRSRRVENGERVRELDRNRYERDKEKRIASACEHVKIRRARMAGVETDPGVTVLSLRKIHGDTCCYCGVNMTFARGKRGEGIAPHRATLEHVLPITKGGTHTFANTALACHRCNVTKNDRTVEEWKEAGGYGWKKAVAPGTA